MKKKKKKRAIRKMLICLLVVATLAVSFAVFFDFRKVAAAGEGWAVGIWNDTTGYIKNITTGVFEEQKSGIPTTGWLSSSSDLRGNVSTQKYSVTLAGKDGDAQRAVSGSAWFGIGSRADSGGAPDADLPSLGWLDFAAGSPSFCSGDACHSATLHPQGGGMAGYLDGWAKVRALGENGWVKLKGSNYSVTSDASGVLSGYAWNSGTETADYRDPALGGNSGLGWIDLTGLKMNACDIGCGTATYCPGQKFSTCQLNYCTGAGPLSCSLTGDVSWNCSNGCGNISCNASPEPSDQGECGKLNGAAICDPNTKYTEKDYCNKGTYTLKSASSVLTTWSCGIDSCGEKVSVECSAKARCGWVEMNP